MNTSDSQPADQATEEPPKRENIWMNLGLNVLIPSLLMTKGKSWLGIEDAATLLVIALAFPVCYGIYDFITRKKYNFFSVIGFVSILISGGVGLLELDKDWIAIKEAAIPLLFAVAVLVSLWTPFPLIRTFLYNPEIFNVPKIEAALEQKGTKPGFEKLMVQCTLLLVGSFLLSAALNYGLARYFIRSETGTDEFVQEMGRMTAWSWPVITLPSMGVMMIAFFKLIGGIKRYTGYEVDDVVLVGAPPAKPDEATSDQADEHQEPESTDSTS